MKSEIDLGTLTRRLGLQSANLQGTEETKLIEIKNKEASESSHRELLESLKRLESMFNSSLSSDQAEQLYDFITDKKQAIESILGRSEGSVALSWVVAKLFFDSMKLQVEAKIQELEMR